VTAQPLPSYQSIRDVSPPSFISFFLFIRSGSPHREFPALSFPPDWHRFPTPPLFSPPFATSFPASANSSPRCFTPPPSAPQQKPFLPVKNKHLLVPPQSSENVFTLPVSFFPEFFPPRPVISFLSLPLPPFLLPKAQYFTFPPPPRPKPEQERAGPLSDLAPPLPVDSREKKTASPHPLRPHPPSPLLARRATIFSLCPQMPSSPRQ